MSNSFKDYFHYTRQERNGFIVLLTACIILALLPKVYQTYFAPKTDIDITIKTLPSSSSPKVSSPKNSELFVFDPNKVSKDDLVRLGLSPKVAQNIINYRTKVGQFEQKKDLRKIYTLTEEDYFRLAPYIEIENQPTAYAVPKDVPKSYDNTNTPPPPKSEPVNFPFDPNTATETQLSQLGLSDRVIRTILNFRAKGSFREPSDFQKIFGLSKEDYRRLLPYITIEKPKRKDVAPTSAKPQIPVAKDTVQRKKKFEKVAIDINLAAQEEWQLLAGVGPTYGKRIVNWREKLGGFYSVEQVGEAYGLPDSVFQKIKPQLVLKEATIKKYNINTAAAKELQKHPYLTWQQAQIIVNYRENHGDYQTLDDLKKIRAFKEDFVEKLKPYLEL